MLATKTSVLNDDLNIVILIGEVSSPLISRTLANGDIASSFDLVTNTHEGRLSVPISLEGENDAVIVGAQFCVIGCARRRFFRAGGTVTSRTEVLASSVVPVRRKAQVRKALEGAVSNITDIGIS